MSEEVFEDFEKAFFEAGEAASKQHEGEAGSGGTPNASDTSDEPPVHRSETRLRLLWTWLASRFGWWARLALPSPARALAGRTRRGFESRLALLWAWLAARVIWWAKLRFLSVLDFRLQPLRAVRHEDRPRLAVRRPGLAMAAMVVLVSAVGSLWAAVVLAAVRMG